MKSRATVLFLAALLQCCRSESDQTQSPPQPIEKRVAVFSPVDEIRRSLTEGGAEDKKKALAAILSLDEQTRKKHAATFHDLLRACLADEDSLLRKEAAAALAKLEGGLGVLVASLDLVPEGDEAVLGIALGLLADGLKAADSKERIRAVDMLEEIGKPATDLLLGALADQDADVRLGVLDALWSIGPAAPGFAERLSVLSGDSDPRVRQAAAAALERMKEESEEKPQPGRPGSPPGPRGD